MVESKGRLSLASIWCDKRPWHRAAYGGKSLFSLTFVVHREGSQVRNAGPEPGTEGETMEKRCSLA